MDLLQLRLLLPEGTRLADVRPDQFRLAATPMGDQRVSQMHRTQASGGNVAVINAGLQGINPVTLTK